MNDIKTIIDLMLGGFTLTELLSKANAGQLQNQFLLFFLIFLAISLGSATANQFAIPLKICLLLFSIGGYFYLGIICWIFIIAALLKWSSIWLTHHCLNLIWSLPFLLLAFAKTALIVKMNDLLLASILIILLLLLDYREQKAARWWQRWLDTHLATHDLEQQMTAQQALAASQVKSAALEERIKLSQSIHDEVGHSLSGGLIQMEAAQLVLTKNQQQAADLLDNAIEISRQGIGQIRNLLKNGVPTVEEIGLEKIQAQILEFKRDYHLQTQLTLRGDMKRINGIQWQVLEKNLQEFLTNTLKYADAHQVEIHLLVFNQLLRFTLQNDGVSPGVIKLGLGLRGMQMRAAQLDGQVIFSQHSGFEVSTLLPLTKENEIHHV